MTYGARQFDGVNDIVTGTVGTVDTTDWTIACWAYALSAGEGNVGECVNIDTPASSYRQSLRFNTGMTMVSAQNYGTTDALATTSTTVPTSTWVCLFGTHRVSDKKSRVFIGTQITAVAEAAYTSQVAGVGTRDTGGTRFNVGNNNATTGTVNGSLARVCFVAREWSLAEMEFFRQHGRPAAMEGVRGFWPLYGTLATEPDLSGRGAVGTVTGAIAADGPPLPKGWGPRRSGLVTRAA